MQEAPVVVEGQPAELTEDSEDVGNQNQDQNDGEEAKEEISLEDVVPEQTDPTSGTLEILVYRAELERNVDTFKNQDPYAILKAEGQEYRTKTLNNAGKTPSWKEVWQVKVTDLSN